MPPWQRALLTGASAFALASILVVSVLGAPVYVLVLAASVIALLVNLDTLLGRLASWAIGLIPQRYRWTIERIRIHPNWGAICKGTDSWSDVVVSNWTWHNPDGFDDDDDCSPGSKPAAGPRYVLQIDELTIRLKLSTIYAAVRDHKSIEIALLRVDGLRFNTQRNQRGALNLWRALDLPDDDVNVKSLSCQAARYGGLHDTEPDDVGTPASVVGAQAAAVPQVVPLPPVATAATRAATDYWRPEWGERRPLASAQGSAESDTPQQPRLPFGRNLSKGSSASGSPAGSPASAGGLCAPLLQGTPRQRSPRQWSPRQCSPRQKASPRQGSPQFRPHPQALPKRGYVEEPIGSPRRRPRWGVPVRLDIHRVHLSDVSLWVLDLLTMETHATSRHMDPDKKRIHVHSLNISRTRLEAGDDRRSGSMDDVHGVYLGELVWVIVAEVIPLVLKRSPLMISRTVALAAAFAMKDAAKRLGAKTLQAAHSAGHAIKEAVGHGGLPPGCNATGAFCRVQVHLIGGREVTRKGMAVNVHAYLELVTGGTNGGQQLSAARSEPQMWTKTPRWDESFELRGAASAVDVLRITLYHRKSRQVVGITHKPKEMPERFIGEVCLPLRALLIRDPVISEGGEIVGWFTLTDARGLRQGIACSGSLKLGLRIDSPHLLRDNSSPGFGAPDDLHSQSDWAILG